MKEYFERFDLQTKLEKAKNQHKKLDRGANKSGLKPDAKAENNVKVKFTIVTEEVDINGALLKILIVE